MISYIFSGFDVKEHLMFYVLIILYVALSHLYTFISTEVMIHFFAPIVNEKVKVDSVNLLSVGNG